MKPTILRRAVAGIHGGTFVSLDVVTSVRLQGGQSNPYQGNIMKHVTGMQVMAFQNPAFANHVNKRLRAAGMATDFIAGPRTWGTRLPGRPIVEHNGKTYLEVIVLKSGAVSYTWKGIPIEESFIIGLPNDDRPDAMGVKIRVYLAEHIKRMSINGHEYK